MSTSQAWSAASLDFLAEIARPENAVDPYPFLAWLREHHPVHQTSAGIYFLSRYADTREVLQNRELFRNPERGDVARLFPSDHTHRSQELLLNTVALNNPPAHTRLRRLVSGGFTMRRVEEMRHRIETVCDKLLDAVCGPYADGEVIDLHNSLSVRTPLSVFSELLGVPEDDRVELAAQIPVVLAAMHPGASDETLNRADVVNDKLERYFLGLADERRRAPRDDLISTLTTIHGDDSDALTPDEFVSMLWGLWAGGFTTTIAAIDYGLITMIRNPEAARWLDGGFTRSRSFVDELLRYEPPAMTTAISRYPVEDVVISGKKIQAGSDLRVIFPACNRDAAEFAEPDVFDPGRPNLHRTHLSFGHGLHYCLGAELARMELTLLLPKIRSRLPGLALAAEPGYLPPRPVRSFDRLEVVKSAA